MYVCIFRLSAIGDVCHALAAIQALRAAWPDVQITWIIGKAEYQLLQHIPDIEWIVFDKSKGLSGFWGLYKQLRHRRFDILCHMQVALRANLASLCVRAKRRIGFDPERAKEGHAFVTHESIASQSQPHVIDGFCGFVEKIVGHSISRDALQWDFHLPDAVQQSSKNLIDSTQKTFVICPFASKSERNWLVGRYAAVADYAAAKGYRVILCGGASPQEIQLAQEIENLVTQSVVNRVGQTSLSLLVALLKRVDLVLAPDTGPLHIAVSQGTPTIGLYAHSNPERTGPYRYRDLTVSVYDKAIMQQYNKKAEQLPWGKRAKGANLMELIDIDSVKRAFDRAEHDYVMRE
tara:strand:+ start:6144 stop:7187 length:1044 start_codon:yes stop_codon:yes gene_type:complete